MHKGNADAVFIILINGALSTSTYSNVNLVNGAQSKNVYWKIEGAVTINNYSTFRGTIICNNGALGAINTGVILDGRALATNGALSTIAVDAIATMLPGNCSTVGIQSPKALSNAVTIYPNPFSASISVKLNDTAQINVSELSIFNVVGEEIINVPITNELTTVETNNLPSGLYFYKIMSKNKIIQSGKLIAAQ